MKILSTLLLLFFVVTQVLADNQPGSGSAGGSATESEGPGNNPGTGDALEQASSSGQGGPTQEKAGEGDATSGQSSASGGPNKINGQQPDPGEPDESTGAPDEDDFTAATEAGTTVAGEGCSGNVVSAILGPQVFAEAYDSGYYNARNGGPVAAGELLNCDFEGDCCWRNALPPNDQLEFTVVSGAPDELFAENFEVDAQPEGKYAVAGSPCAEAPEAQALFVSCTIPCTNEPVKVTFSHWTTEGVKLEVCIRHAFFNNPATPKLHCIPVDSANSPGPTTVELPPGEAFDVVIAASNFVSEFGGMAIVDNIVVEYVLCPRGTMPTAETTTASPHPDPTPSTTTEIDTTESTTTDVTTETDEPTTTTPGDGECQAFICRFEGDSPCNYEIVSSVSDRRTLFRGPRPNLGQRLTAAKIETFTIKKGRFMNYITGIYEAAEGEGYLAAYLKRNMISAIVAKYTLNEPRVFRFNYYSATQGIGFSGCCRVPGEKPICKMLVDPKEMILQNNRKWKVAQLFCPAGTTEVGFECSTLKTANQGACGIDNIELHVYDEDLYDENDPTTPLPLACVDFDYRG